MTTPTLPGVPGPVVPLVELGVGDRYDAATIAALWGGAGVVGPARWSTPGDENEWGGHEPLWHDIACETLDVSTAAGRDGTVERFGIGTATIVVRNRDGWADYKPLADDTSLLTVRPGRQIRVGVAVAGGAPVYLWRGVLDTTEPGYDPVEGDVVTFGCVDAKGDAGRAKLPKTLEPVGYGESASTRIHRTLNNSGWPAWRRAVDQSDVQLLATSFGSQVADELDVTAESCSGHVYGDTAGRVAFRRKDWMTWPGSAPVDATVGNVATGDVCPSGWEVRFGRDDLTTVAIVGRDGETPFVSTNAEAFGLYGYEPWERLDVSPVDNFEIVRVASRVLSARSPATMPRIAAVTLDATTGDGRVAALLAAASPFKPTRLRCRHRAGDGRLVFDRTMFVVGVRHTLSPVDGWTARLALDDAMPYRNVDNPARWSDANTKWSDDDAWAQAI